MSLESGFGASQPLTMLSDQLNAQANATRPSSRPIVPSSPAKLNKIDRRPSFSIKQRSPSPNDPRRVSASPSTSTISNPPRPFPKSGANSYVPPFKRARTSSSLTDSTTTTATSANIPTGPRLSSSSARPKRRVVCGSCTAHRQADLCNGGVYCNGCRSVGAKTCVYHLCRYGTGCTYPYCTFLHPEQWDQDGSGRARKVLDRDGREIGGHEV